MCSRSRLRYLGSVLNQSLLETITIMNNILGKALAWAKEKHSEAPVAHQCAFANSVQYLCTGWSGGPSIREHACSHALADSLSMPGDWGFEAACKFAEPICFGPITRLHFDCYRIEHCFDDAPEDLLALQNFRQGA
jgi:hypothetical protein